MNEYLVITWADSVPAGDGLADAARDRDGQLLAAGPVHDASELDSRPATTRARMTFQRRPPGRPGSDPEAAAGQPRARSQHWPR